MELVVPEVMVVMEARVRQLVPVEPEAQRERAVPVQLVELSMVVDLPDTILERSQRFIQLVQFQSPVPPVVLVAMEAMVETEVMGDRRAPVEWEVRRVQLRLEVLVARFMLEDLLAITLPLELSLVLGLRVR